MSDPLICVGAIAGAHGVHGAVKVKSFTVVPADFASYGPLLGADGEVLLHPKNPRPVGKNFTFRSPEISTREQAEALKGTQLFVRRSMLPVTEEDDFYYSDLVGLDVKSTDGKRVGKVVAVHAFGAGDMLEIKPPKTAEKTASFYHPFTKTAVPKVDIKAGRVIVQIVEPISGKEEDASNAAADIDADGDASI